MKELFTGIVLAAGSGQRFGGATPKQFCQLTETQTVLERSCQSITAAAQALIVALPEAYIEDKALRHHLAELAEAQGCSLQLVAGGSSRQDSLQQALPMVRSEYCLVHDAARPLVHQNDLQTLLLAVQENGAAILAAPLTDTLKASRTEHPSQIDRTIPRESLWIAQTPQGFRTDRLREALGQAIQDGFQGTDEATLLERLGQTVQLVAAQQPNPKLTTPSDLALLRAYLSNR